MRLKLLYSSKLELFKKTQIVFTNPVLASGLARFDHSVFCNTFRYKKSQQHLSQQGPHETRKVRQSTPSQYCSDDRTLGQRYLLQWLSEYVGVSKTYPACTLRYCKRRYAIWGLADLISGENPISYCVDCYQLSSPFDYIITEKPYIYKYRSFSANVVTEESPFKSVIQSLTDILPMIKERQIKKEHSWK